MNTLMSNHSALGLVALLALGLTGTSILPEARANPCDEEEVLEELVEETLGLDVTDISTSRGFSMVQGIQFQRTGCSLEVGEDTELEVREIGPDPEEVWTHFFGEAEKEALKDSTWTDALADTDLSERAEAVTVEDDELLLKTEDATWFFGFDSFGDDPDNEDRRQLVEAAHQAFSDETVEEESICEIMAPAIDRAFGLEGEIPDPSHGGAFSTGGESHSYRSCDFEVEKGDLVPEVGIGDEGLYEHRLNSTQIGSTPQILDIDVGDGTLWWRERLLVRVGDEVLLLSGDADEEEMDWEALMPLAEALVAYRTDTAE